MAKMPDVFFAINKDPRARTPIRHDTNGLPQTLSDAIPDGDTIGIHLFGSGAIRFLGIDTPEKSFDLPLVGGSNLDSAQWEAYLTDPFQSQFTPFNLDPDLEAHLRSRIGSGAGVNHLFHGNNAEQALISLVQSDMTALGQDTTTFRFYIAFSYEVFDTYGRFLAFINRQQPDKNLPVPRPMPLNDRMLETGSALPYFIWPNIAPFRLDSILAAVPEPKTANKLANTSPELKRARTLVAQARTNGDGVFDPVNPLRFEAFEIRYLGRRDAPNRAVIDLSKNDDVILRPQNYFRIPNPEDRLFIPPEFVPLFASRGWKLEGWF
jgi:hypothetical protein